MNNFDDNLWKKCIDFHGHACPGLAIGYKACELALKELNIQFSSDEELVCVSETDACGVDAIQYITGCTLGKGNLIYRSVGKQAFSFFERESGNNIRVVLNNIQKDFEDRDTHIQWFLNKEVNSLFEIKSPHYDLPDKAQIFDTVICEECGEGTAEYAIRLQEGKKVCKDCFDDYSPACINK